MNMDTLVYAVPATGLLALAFAWLKTSWVAKQDAGTDEMKGIADAIQEGAMAFLAREYKVLSVFVAVVAVLLAAANRGDGQDPLIALSFIAGAALSALAGYFVIKTQLL